MYIPNTYVYLYHTLKKTEALMSEERTKTYKIITCQDYIITCQDYIITCQDYIITRQDRLASQNILHGTTSSRYEIMGRVHTEKAFPNLITSNRNQIVFTKHGLIWNSKRTRSVCCSKSIKKW